MASTTVTWRSLVCAPTACDRPLPRQGDSAGDPAVAFVDIPGDEACAPSTCIQVGVPPCPASAHLPGAALGPGLLWEVPSAPQPLWMVLLGKEGACRVGYRLC